MNALTFDSKPTWDTKDWQILEALQEDARLGYAELGRKVRLSAPAVAERVKRLEEAGVITGYRAQVDPRRLGYDMEAMIRLRCDGGTCARKQLAGRTPDPRAPARHQGDSVRECVHRFPSFGAGYRNICSELDE